MLFSCKCVTVVLEKMNNRLILQLGPYTCLWMFVSAYHSTVPTLELRTYRHFK